MKYLLLISGFLFATLPVHGELPKLLTDPKIAQAVYLPDYSYAGYGFGERQPDYAKAKIYHVEEHGLRANDNLDDTQALQQLLEKLASSKEPAIIQFGPGRYILSDIIPITRSHLVLRGTGSGSGGTELYFPRPLNFVGTPEPLEELQEYLVRFNKVQREKHNNLELPYTLWSWSGGFLWVQLPGQRVKAYLDEYHQPDTVLARGQKGEKGGHVITVDNTAQLKVGDVVQVNWYNREGKKSSLLDDIYQGSKIEIGAHHWEFPTLALSRQQAKITAIKGRQVFIKTPLLHAVKPEWHVELIQWEHLEEVGLEAFRVTFPETPDVAHHVEQGFNAVYLTRLFNGWVRDVKIENSDSGILTEEIANVSITDVETSGSKLAHYSVQIGGVHNVLVENLLVRNPVRHALSFNTFANRNVYLNCRVENQPVFDQHSGVNHQNLFDNTWLSITLPPSGAKTYPLFEGGGAKYWKPSHGSFSTFWNTRIHFTNRTDTDDPVTLYGVKDGPFARLIGFSANQPLKIDYGPDAYIEGIDQYYRHVPSLYYHQLEQRLSRDAAKH